MPYWTDESTVFVDNHIKIGIVSATSVSTIVGRAELRSSLLESVREWMLELEGTQDEVIAAAIDHIQVDILIYPYHKVSAAFSFCIANIDRFTVPRRSIMFKIGSNINISCRSVSIFYWDGEIWTQNRFPSVILVISRSNIQTVLIGD